MHAMLVCQVLSKRFQNKPMEVRPEVETQKRSPAEKLNRDRKMVLDALDVLVVGVLKNTGREDFHEVLEVMCSDFLRRHDLRLNSRSVAQCVTLVKNSIASDMSSSGCSRVKDD